MIKGSLWNIDLENIFRNNFGSDIARCDILSSHGSDRIILRLFNSNKNTAIGIINKDLKENKAFIEFSRHFRKFNLNVPMIFGVSDDMKCYVIEDLGDTTLFARIGGGNGSFSQDLKTLYKEALQELTKFQIQAGPGIDYSLCTQFHEFGEDNISYDLKYFKESFLDNYHKDYSVEKLNSDFAVLRSKLLECPRDYFLYRDFQSRNIMLKDNMLYFIDYQSGRKGALQYDVASLLYDARADLPQQLREELIKYYISEAKKQARISEDEFVYYFWYFAIIRILQALGAYGFLGLTRGKKKFLDSIPYALKNMKFILNNRIENGQLNYLKHIFDKEGSIKLSPLYERTK
jgi:aminoglycoside/choline kinase family phosphotransferase